jgi:hypothetical protein
MKLNTRHKVLGGIGAGALVIGVGAALAVTKNGGSNQRQTFFNAANAAAQPSAFPSGRLPRFGSRLGGPMHRGLLGHDAVLSGVADYLGLTVNQLRTKIESGDTLAAIAKAQGKTVDGLKSAIVDLTKKQLDKAVAAKDLTQAQASQILSRLQSHLDTLVNRSPKDGPPAGMPGGMHGPPMGMPGATGTLGPPAGMPSSAPMGSGI